MKIIKYIVLYFVVCITYANELLFINNLKNTLLLDDQTYETLALHATQKECLSCYHSSYFLPLFRAYPSLAEKIPYISLGSFPTPVQKLTILETMYGIHNLFIKQDSLSGGINADGIQSFGGNKVRKLEFLLADALQYNAQSVLTFGCIGLNHATATATYAQQCGLRCYCMLNPQLNSSVVERNLTLMSAAGAELIFSRNAAERKANTIKVFFDSKKNYGDYPYPISTGGSVALGAVGFVNAAFELAHQIKQQLLPEPDYIYIAAGSFGTAAGLSLGLKAAGIQSRIIAVCVEPEGESGSVERKINVLFKKTNELLHAHDSTFPLFIDGANNVAVIHEFGGIRYGVPTSEAIDAMHDAQKYENIILDGTYTGKAFAALVAHARKGMFDNKNVLFWNTFCSDGL